MKIQSELSKKAYLRAMKGSMEPFSSFGQARFIGTIIGCTFSVTYCSGYEWNRRITNEKNRAIGFVREKDGGTEVRFLRLKGMTNPVSLLMIYILYVLIFAVSEPVLLGNGFVWLIALVGTLIIAVITAIQDTITDEGEAGQRLLMRFLQDPEPFSRWY